MGRKKKIIEAVNPSSYILTFKVNGRSSTTTGSSVLEALREIKPEPFKTKGLITVEHNGNKIERLFAVFKLRKLFSSKITQEIIANTLSKGI